MKTEMIAKLSRNMNRVGLHLQKHSPEILIAGGLIGMVTSAVLACRATTKLEAALEEPKKQIEQLKAVKEESTELSTEDYKKNLSLCYIKAGARVAKLYAPSVALGMASTACILASHGIIHKRNAALAAAYATVDRSFKDYRERVIERFGKELDRELKYNIKTEEVEETVVDKNGKEKTEKKTVHVAAPSEYARIFDETCYGWDRNAEYNKKFLIHQQNQANDRLKHQGHLFLNEVYDLLGMERSAAGSVVGWIYDENDPTRDNYVDFGIFDDLLNNEAKRLFINGHERSILLDFNVDGVIYDLLR